MEQTKKCPSCGGTMIFQPGFNNLLCQSCGHKETIPELVSKIPVNELDFLTAQNTASHDWGMEAKVVTCKQCGAETIQNKLQLSGLCPFCGSTTVEAADPAQDIMAPNGIIPFRSLRSALFIFSRTGSRTDSSRLNSLHRMRSLISSTVFTCRCLLLMFLP